VKPEAITVRDAAGERFDASLVGRETDGSLTIRTPDGLRLVIPAEAIERLDGSDVHLAVPLTDIGVAANHGAEEQTVPIVEEQAVVAKRSRPTATVRVRTRTHEREEEIDETLSTESVDVRRVPVERMVDSPAPIREEGDTTIVPVHEEVLVVEKRLMLKEELHLTKRKEDRREQRRVTLRSQIADIERSDPDEA
jgi:stress response protein YsnF